VRWVDDINCAGSDPELFFDEKREGEACQVCDGCPGRVPCLEEALLFDLRWGVFGGLTRDERKPLRRAYWAARAG
jgi:WhiB family redox-sensing transcriptional regulator